jgi:hypothetical protein
MGCGFVKWNSMRRQPYKEAWQQGPFERLLLGSYVDIDGSLTRILHGLKSGRSLVC